MFAARLGISIALYDVAKAPAVYSALLYIALVVVSEYLCLILLNVLGFDVETLMVEGNARAIFLVLAKTAQLAVILTAASALRKNRTALTLKQVLPLLPCLLASVYICVLFFGVFTEYGEGQSLFLMIAVLGLLYINGMIVFHTQTIKRTVFEAEEQKASMQNYEMQARYYESILKNREEMRAIRHDLQKHITAIKALVENGDNKDAKVEYEQIKSVYNGLESIVDVGNPTIDAILHHNILRAKSENVSVKLTARVPPELNISAVDLSVIIGNTFDNAIEECCVLSDGNSTIFVSLIHKKRMLFYEIANPCAQIPRKKPGNIHGYGLQNIRRCVEKYNGSMSNGIVDGQYRVSIWLDCKASANAE